MLLLRSVAFVSQPSFRPAATSRVSGSHQSELRASTVFHLRSGSVAEAQRPSNTRFSETVQLSRQNRLHGPEHVEFENNAPQHDAAMQHAGDAALPSRARKVCDKPPRLHGPFATVKLAAAAPKVPVIWVREAVPILPMNLVLLPGVVVPTGSVETWLLACSVRRPLTGGGEIMMTVPNGSWRVATSLAARFALVAVCLSTHWTAPRRAVSFEQAAPSDNDSSQPSHDDDAPIPGREPGGVTRADYREDDDRNDDPSGDDRNDDRNDDPSNDDRNDDQPGDGSTSNCSVNRRTRGNRVVNVSASFPDEAPANRDAAGTTNAGDANDAAAPAARSKKGFSRVRQLGQTLRGGLRGSDTATEAVDEKKRDDNSPEAIAQYFSQMTKGTSSSTVRKKALAAIPLDKLSAEHRAAASEVLKNVSYFRRMPTLTFPADPEVYNYFLTHPDVTVSMWRAMNISKMQVTAVSSETFTADTKDGTTGRLELLYRSPEKLVVLSEGSYSSPLLARPIQARSLLVLQTTFFKETDGNVYCTHRGDLFVSFPSHTVEAVARVISPLTVNMTDRTFCEISLFAKMMSAAMGSRPGWVEGIVGRMDGVPEAEREELLRLTGKQFMAEQKRRELIAARQTATEDDIEPTEPVPGRTVPTKSVPTKPIQTAGEVRTPPR